MFYAYQVIRPALLTAGCLEKGDKQQPLVISVDDIHERMIFSRAQRVSRRVRSSSYAHAYDRDNAHSNTIRPSLIEIYTPDKSSTEPRISRACLYIMLNHRLQNLS